MSLEGAEKIWWTKTGAAVGIAVLTLVVQVYFNVEGSIVFMFGALVYMGLSDLLSRMNGVEPSRGLRIGMGAYFFIWITTWVLLYTFLQPTA